MRLAKPRPLLALSLASLAMLTVPASAGAVAPMTYAHAAPGAVLHLAGVVALFALAAFASFNLSDLSSDKGSCAMTRSAFVLPVVEFLTAALAGVAFIGAAVAMGVL